MGNNSLTRFLRKVDSDPKLQRELDGLFKHTGDRRVATGAAIVDLAARHGFQFTADELKKHLATTGREGELSEADLEAVAGGITWQFVDGGIKSPRGEAKGIVLF